MLYIFWFLHQTTTTKDTLNLINWLYIFWFLHQTTTILRHSVSIMSCISFDSYIKPQLFSCLWTWFFCCISFDSYIKPQLQSIHISLPIVVYLLIPTSNHNYQRYLELNQFVVYLLIPTSNHNTYDDNHLPSELYIFWFLHQTTTLIL